jgi:VanZ family protein
MALILWLGSDTGSSQHTGSLVVPILRFLFPSASPLQIEAMHGLVRKAAHVAEYALLAALWLRAFMAGGGRPWRAAAWRTLLIAGAWAAIDEAMQSTLRARTGSPFDVAIDTAAAAAVILPTGFGWRPVVDSVTSVLLWTAAVGGAVLIAINLAAGVPPGALWLTAPFAFLLLYLRRRMARRAPFERRLRRRNPAAGGRQ